MLFRLSALLAGLIFGLGLILSGMTNPTKILGFLDIAGPWDPSLALVMGGAIAITLPTFLLLKRRDKTFLQLAFQWPQRRDIDTRLVIGSILFGIGWGVAGFCPGPAIVALSSGLAEVLTFVAAMLIGMALFTLFNKARRQ